MRSYLTCSPLLRLGLLTGLALAAGHAANAGDPAGDPMTRHAQEVESWRQDRLDRLQRPDGWLSLVGLAWLEEGENACGSDPASVVPLPATAPPRAGAFLVHGGDVTFVSAPGSGVTHQGGEPAERLPLVADADGAPTVLELGTIQFHVIRRGDRLGVRVKDSESPVRTEFLGIEHYPLSGEWRLEGRFEPYEPPKPVPVPNVLGTVDEELSPGAAVFEADGRTLRLDVLEGEGAEVFVIFGDETNGAETYGGGRFLYAERTSDGRIVLDFNKAYNPPCAFTPYATCPLPPRQNRLPVAVRAGEKKYGEGHH